jgi:predicted nucleic acid-binding protein
LKAAYVDTSYLVAIALAEPGAAEAVASLRSYTTIYSSTLLEAELRSVLRREASSVDPAHLLSNVTWMYPDRPLTQEINIVLQAGYLRGADLWHVAVALFTDPDRQSDFLTLDARQRAISASLGFGPR